MSIEKKKKKKFFLGAFLSYDRLPLDVLIWSRCDYKPVVVSRIVCNGGFAGVTQNEQGY